MKPSRSTAVASPERDRPRAVIVYICWGLSLGVAGYFPAARLWGLNFFAFVSPVVQSVFGAVYLLLLFYIIGPSSFSDSVHRGLRKLSRALGNWGGGIVTVIAVGLGGWFLRAQTALLGDGTLRATDAVEGAAWFPSEVIPTLLSARFARGLPASWNVDRFDAVALVSIVFAVLFAVGVWWLAPKATPDRKRSVVFWILTFGSVRLLAGYIEAYTPGFAAVTLWVLAALAYRAGRLSWIWVVGLWAVAILSHITAIILVPATLWLFWSGPVSQPGQGKPAQPGAMQRVPFWSYLGTVLLLGGALLELFRRFQISKLGVTESHFLVSLTSQEPHHYGFFAIAHLLDLVNHAWLLAPAALIAVLVSVNRQSLKSLGRHLPWRTRGGLQKISVFWALAAGLPLLAGSVIDPKLGWARDWDLFCLLATPALTGAALWLKEQRGALKRTAVSVALLSAAIWIVFSVDATAERSRFVALLELDPSRSDYGHEIMGQYYRRAGDYEATLSHYMKALAVSENIRYRQNIAAALMKLGRVDQGTRWFRGIVARDSLLAGGQHGLAMALEIQGKMAEALQHAGRAVALEPAKPRYRYQYAKVMMGSGDIEGALPHFEMAARSQPFDPIHIHGLGVCYLALQRLPEARTAFEQALRRDPGNSSLVLDAARVTLLQSDLAETGRLLQRYEQLVPPARRLGDYRLIADSLTQLVGGG
jgi:tetratricopeptide (TPR) repeat protein